MTKNEFENLFIESLQLTAKNAEEIAGRPVPYNFKILLYGAGYSGSIMSPNEALNILYLGEHIFYRIIDLSVAEVAKDYTIIFVRVSDHKPADFGSTWNQPKGFGPFKQLIPDSIKFS